MQSELRAGAQVSVPKMDDLHVTENREFIKTFNPETDSIDREL
jgi:hypothetical protein